MSRPVQHTSLLEIAPEHDSPGPRFAEMPMPAPALPGLERSTSLRPATAAGGSRYAHLGEWRNRLAARGLGLLPGRWQPSVASAFGILMYHRVVAPPTGVAEPTWNVAPQRFRAQLAGLLRQGYRPWPLAKVLAHHTAGQTIPAKTFVVTFDDIYENVYLNAFPVLRELEIPATCFLTTGFLDSPAAFPFDDWACAGSPHVGAESWRPVTTPQCQEMLASGLVELGSHTHSHADFRGRPDEFGRDLALALEVLRSRFGAKEANFAFPYGYGCRHDDGPELSEAARQAGARCALTTDSELVRPGDDPLNWGRFAALGTDSVASLVAKLDGRYSLARTAWRRLRGRSSGGRGVHGTRAASPSTR